MSETQPTAVFCAQSHAVKQCVNIMNEDWEYTFFFFFPRLATFETKVCCHEDLC